MAANFKKQFNFLEVYMINEDFLEYLEEDTTRFDKPNLDDAIIGYSSDGRIVYDSDLMIESLMENEGKSMDEAFDWIERIALRLLPFMGDHCPVIFFQCRYIR
jgi:hypothetical protein